jgi:hypothetical protein
MAHTDLRTALRRTNEIEITMTGHSSGRSFSCLSPTQTRSVVYSTMLSLRSILIVLYKRPSK